MIKSTGIILELIAFSESSFILKVLTFDRAQISVIAKGWRKKPEPLLRFVEYELCLAEPREEGLYILREASPRQDLSHYPNTATWAAAEAGAEFISKIIISPTEAKAYYTLLREYLRYLEKTPTNAVLIFWRLILRIFEMMGIGLRLQYCDICKAALPALARNSSGDLICKICYADLPANGQYQPLSSDAQTILHLLPEIGKHLDKITLTGAVLSELNRLFADYYAAHTKHTLKLKSLSVLSQFY